MPVIDPSWQKQTIYLLAQKWQITSMALAQTLAKKRTIDGHMTTTHHLLAKKNLLIFTFLIVKKAELTF